jgi:hypothetical protein
LLYLDDLLATRPLQHHCSQEHFVKTGFFSFFSGKTYDKSQKEFVPLPKEILFLSLKCFLGFCCISYSHDKPQEMTSVVTKSFLKPDCFNRHKSSSAAHALQQIRLFCAFTQPENLQLTGHNTSMAE